ncbi:HNH endonuclease [Methylobacterium sp. J-070]|uniref:HNH endonuclease n=1 Tax=Methylobacterium sp. J-070 TaxID=2836650 RepID=UPI001FB8ADD3|nr:HNH endonuclease [Methylobacterium sp. J-070]MCJ2053696.1 HNH endonuclease [Methylobacterium sp. J-070]
MKTYDPVGRCIYCGEDKGRLGEEHIIPLGLDGNIVLPLASCDDCSTITGKFEGVVQRTMLGNIRVKLGMKTRRKKDRPKKLDIFIKTSAGEEATPVPVSEFPHMFALPLLGKARVLHGLPEFHSDVIGCGFWANAPEDEVRPYLKDENHKLRIGAVRADFFCRMLSKIAYSFAVAEFGYGAFKPLVLPIILGKSNNYGHLVGGDPQAPLASEHLHDVSWEYQIVRLQVYIVVNIRLFSKAGAPQYHVVVGTTGIITPQQRQALDQEARQQANNACPDLGSLG